ncbi:MAG: hypothetical protein K1X88_18385 [Nannocystaceae bacterium]|nr:hypothetical protein [Nannocystaceae bacterium]
MGALVLGLLGGEARASVWSVRALPAPESSPPSQLRRAAPQDAATTEAVRREAAAAFADGEAAFERGDYETASARFDRAQALSPHPWTLYNLALSHARAGHALAAWRAFDALASQAPGAPERREAERERDALLPLLAQVRFEGSGTRACLDGEPVRVYGGAATRVVEPGLHRITTLRGDDNVALDAGTTLQVDTTPPRRRADATVVLAAVGIAGGTIATGGGIPAAALAERPVAQGFAAVAAIGGTAAIVAGAVAIARHRRAQAAARAVPSCLRP